MKKGQGATNRKTLMEAIYGPAGAGEAGKHVALLSDKVHLAQAIKINQGAIEDGLGDIGQLKKNVVRLHKLSAEINKQIEASWKSAMNRPLVMEQLAKVSRVQRDNPMGCAYHAEFMMVSIYEAAEAGGQRISYEKLRDLVSVPHPQMTDSTFSKILKRYDLKPQKGKPGPKPERAKRQ